MAGKGGGEARRAGAHEGHRVHPDAGARRCRTCQAGGRFVRFPAVRPVGVAEGRPQAGRNHGDACARPCGTARASPRPAHSDEQAGLAIHRADAAVGCQDADGGSGDGHERLGQGHAPEAARGPEGVCRPRDRLPRRDDQRASGWWQEGLFLSGRLEQSPQRNVDSLRQTNAAAKEQMSVLEGENRLLAEESEQRMRRIMELDLALQSAQAQKVRRRKPSGSPVIRARALRTGKSRRRAWPTLNATFGGPRSQRKPKASVMWPS
ncbi:hypothetical protein DFJ74DRAFT_666205 [Hyaloraphidium curvatum]|nr:hypothetical protein DFJ74DRAFT_666205 [Hyaloraphidium curvatum]